MAKEALAYIKQTEEEAKKLTEQAAIQAAQIVDDANKKAEADIEALSESDREMSQAQKAQATEKGRQAQQEFNAETDRMCEELSQSLLKNKEKAVDAAVRVIAGK